MLQLFRTKSVDQIMGEPAEEGTGLKRVLTAKDLMALGVGAIIGAGIFATTGTAAAGGGEHIGAGPAITLSYVLVAIACGFCALCYAEFASLIPIAGSAYTYAYATLGELIAWIIGWDLILEYAVGNVAVAISWSGYLGSLMRSIKWHGQPLCPIPVWLLTPSGQMENLPPELSQAPIVAGHHFYFNLPAILIVAFLTILLVRGVRESVSFNNFVVLVKLLVIVFFIAVGVGYVEFDNWVPYMPNGWAGVQSGAAAVFFAYIGFDAVSTAAEETENPEVNLPIGMIGSLILCTILYILVSAVLTGMCSYKLLGTADPMTTAFETIQKAHPAPILNWATFIVAIGAVFSMTAVLLVFQMGQPRIFFSMSRDGLLPPVFAKVHPVFQTPYVTTILTGCFVGISAAFLDISAVIELCNIGTLFAFVIVAASVLLLRFRDARDYQNINNVRPYTLWAGITIALTVLFLAIAVLCSETGLRLWGAFMAPCFLIVGIIFLKVGPSQKRPFNCPLVPLAPMCGVASCMWLMLGLPWMSWKRLFWWLVFGMIIYVFYGYRHSRLNKETRQVSLPD